MQNLQMPLEQAFSIIDQALSQLNANRETHALMATAVQRIKGEVGRLEGELDASEQHVQILEAQIKDLGAQLEQAASEVVNAIT